MDNYLALFKVTTEDMKQLIAIALSKGGDYADLYFEYSISNELTLRDNQVNAIASNIDFGVGIRVLKGDQTGYAYCEGSDIKELKRAAATAAQIANSLEGGQVVGEPNKLQFTNKYPVITPWEECGVIKKKEYLLELNQMLFQADERIKKVVERVSDADSKIMFFNSLGDFYCDHRPIASITASCVAIEEGATETCSVSRSYRMGCEMLSKELQQEIVTKMKKQLESIFTAKQPKGGKMAVVMGAGASGILLHEAIGHAFEADFNRKGTSIFSDKMGKQICSKKINVVDDGTLTANRGAVNVDDEGVLGQKTYMVKEGILNSYLHDRISAAFYGVAPTGNGRRESFRFNPIPRMRATYMENGNCTEADIIKSVKKGIYVDNFLNGQVQIGAGDFTFYVKSGRLIENGKLTAPIKDINIIGNGPKALADILEVADNNTIENSTWTCGKEQYCYVSCGMPSVLVKSLIVGGEN